MTKNLQLRLFKMARVQIFCNDISLRQKIEVKILIDNYHVTQQCCLETTWRPPQRPIAGGLRIFWAKSLVFTAIYTKIKLKFVFLAVITSDLAQKIPRPPAEGLRGVSGRFLPGQHCWATWYMIFVYHWTSQVSRTLRKIEKGQIFLQRPQTRPQLHILKICNLFALFGPS